MSCWLSLCRLSHWLLIFFSSNHRCKKCLSKQNFTHSFISPIPLFHWHRNAVQTHSRTGQACKQSPLAFTIHSPHYYTHTHPKHSLVYFQRNYIHMTAFKITTKHTLIQSGSSGPRKVFPLTLSENWQAGQTTNNYPRSTGGKNRRLRKQIWVMSSKLNGKPCVRETGESIHIYCCQDFNINIIESTSDVSLSTDWFTKRSTNCHLYLMKMKIQQKG